MKKLFRLFTCLLLPVLLFSAVAEAVMIKRPLTVKQYADQYYFEWVGTASVTSNDSIEFMADTTTANLYSVDPQYLLFINKSATAGFNPWRTHAGGKVPEKVCSNIAVTAISDAVDITWGIYYSVTKSSTNVLHATTTAVTHGSLVGAINSVGVPYDPGKFIKYLGVMTTATDTATVTRFTSFPCDD